jgi:hypothetical protein
MEHYVTPPSVDAELKAEANSLFIGAFNGVVKKLEGEEPIRPELLSIVADMAKKLTNQLEAGDAKKNMLGDSKDRQGS